MVFVYLSVLLQLLSATQNIMTPEQRFKTTSGPTLAARLAEASRRAQAERPPQPFWVAYGFKVRHGVAVDVMPEPGLEQQNLGLFIHYAADGREVAGFEVYALDRAHRFEGQVYWLGDAPNVESLEYLRGLLRAARGSGLYSHLLEAVAMHEGQEATALLEEIKQSPDAKQERSLAAYWLKERSSAERPFADMPGEVAALAAILRDPAQGTPRRARAAQALGVMADPAGIRELAKYYPEADDADLKRRILGGAANKVNADSVALYASAAAEADERLKREALSWLGEKAGNRLALSHAGGQDLSAAEVERERRRLADISRGPQSEAVPALIEVARSHPSEEVRREAISRLNRADDPRVLAFYREVLERGVAEPLSAGRSR
ncbi:MAG: hypothetical protein JOZ96_20710 [Acidobacteria bacterium]|nr:hypothetical protein [Acidobacteriota bacterium]